MPKSSGRGYKLHVCLTTPPLLLSPATNCGRLFTLSTRHSMFFFHALLVRTQNIHLWGHLFRLHTYGVTRTVYPTQFRGNMLVGCCLADGAMPDEAKAKWNKMTDRTASGSGSGSSSGSSSSDRCGIRTEDSRVSFTATVAKIRA